MIYLIFSCTIYSNCSFLCISHSSFCWDDQEKNASTAQQGKATWMHQSFQRPKHITSLAEIAFPLLVTSPGGSGLSVCGNGEQPPFLFWWVLAGSCSSFSSKASGTFPSSCSFGIFRSTALSAVRVKCFPTFALSSFQRWSLQGNSSTATFSECLTQIAAAHGNQNHHMDVLHNINTC